MTDTSDVVSREDIEAMILARTVEDPAFAARLKADPKAALSEILGAELPAALEVHVFQETPTDLLLRLPAVQGDEISEDELESVAGGLSMVRPLPRPGRPGSGVSIKPFPGIRPGKPKFPLG